MEGETISVGIGSSSAVRRDCPVAEAIAALRTIDAIAIPTRSG